MRIFSSAFQDFALTNILSFNLEEALLANICKHGMALFALSSLSIVLWMIVK